jgi:hypothetical protein
MKNPKVRKLKVFKSGEKESALSDFMTFRLDGLSERAVL